MQQLKLAAVLPLINLTAAVAILHTIQPDGHSGPSLLLQICWGLNAPAFLLWNYHLPRTVNEIAPGWLVTVVSSELYFMVGILMTWFLVGHELDQRNVHGARKGAIGLIVDGLLLVVGSLLLWMAVEDCRSPHTEFYSELHGPSVRGLFFLVWSFSLIYVSLKRFAARTRRGRGLHA